MNYPVFTSVAIFRNPRGMGFYIVGKNLDGDKYIIDAMGRCFRVAGDYHEPVFFSTKTLAEKFIEDHLSGDTFI